MDKRDTIKALIVNTFILTLIVLFSGCCYGNELIGCDGNLIDSIQMNNINSEEYANDGVLYLAQGKQPQVPTFNANCVCYYNNNSMVNAHFFNRPFMHESDGQLVGREVNISYNGCQHPAACNYRDVGSKGTIRIKINTINASTGLTYNYTIVGSVVKVY